jgi:hypothetical protein
LATVVAQFGKFIGEFFKEMKSEWRNESMHYIYTVPFSEPSELSAVKDTNI